MCGFTTANLREVQGFGNLVLGFHRKQSNWRAGQYWVAEMHSSGPGTWWKVAHEPAALAHLNQVGTGNHSTPASEIIWHCDLQIYELREDIPNPFYQPPSAKKKTAPPAEGAADAKTAPMETSQTQGSEEKGSGDDENGTQSNGQDATASWQWMLSGWSIVWLTQQGHESGKYWKLVFHKAWQRRLLTWMNNRSKARPFLWLLLLMLMLPQISWSLEIWWRCERFSFSIFATCIVFIYLG